MNFLGFQGRGAGGAWNSTHIYQGGVLENNTD